MRRAFSLIELSIVLVIIGLLVGGIMAGQSLIHAGELRAVMTEYQKFLTAFTNFKDKYNALPGDMPNAQSYWGAGTCPGTSGAPATGPATCNGNGDGYVNSPGTANETFRMWQHLANAGLIEGFYTGVPNSATWSAADILIGTNIPKSKLANAGWMVLYFGVRANADTAYFEGNYGHGMFFGASNPTCCPSSAIMKPEDAWNIDSKLDDGKPGTGNVVVPEYTGPNSCHDQTPGAGALANIASYSLTLTGINCLFIFKNVM